MYGEVKELFPDYAASPMWKYFKLTHYVVLNYPMTNSLVVPLQTYFIWSIKLQWIGIIGNRVLWRHPHMVSKFFRP